MYSFAKKKCQSTNFFVKSNDLAITSHVPNESFFFYVGKNKFKTIEVKQPGKKLFPNCFVTADYLMESKANAFRKASVIVSIVFKT